MSVPESKRAENKLQVLLDAQSLAAYTLRICKNPKVFTPDFQHLLTEKRKLKRLVNKARKGTLTKAKVYDCYNAWKAHASVGNSNKLIQRMDSYFKNLWR